MATPYFDKCLNSPYSASQSILKTVCFEAGYGKIGAKELQEFMDRVCTYGGEEAICVPICQQRPPSLSCVDGIGNTADSAAAEMQQPVVNETHRREPVPAIFQRYKSVRAVPIRSLRAGGSPETVQRERPISISRDICSQGGNREKGRFG